MRILSEEGEMKVIGPTQEASPRVLEELVHSVGETKRIVLLNVGL
jgi:hypothetical protein